MKFDDEHGWPQMVCFGYDARGLERVETPTGAPCSRCQRAIAEDALGVCVPFYDDGWSMLPTHAACFRAWVGLTDQALN